VLNKFVGWWPAVELMKQYLRGTHRMQRKAEVEGVEVEDKEATETPELNALEDFEEEEMDKEMEVDSEVNDDDVDE
jgi:hypothetical protein